MEQNDELKILRLKEKLRKEIASDQNMIDYYIKDKAKSFLAPLSKCERDNEMVQLDKKLFEEIYYFLSDFSQGKINNIHDYIGQYVSSKEIRQDILKDI